MQDQFDSLGQVTNELKKEHDHRGPSILQDEFQNAKSTQCHFNNIGLHKEGCHSNTVF